MSSFAIKNPYFIIVVCLLISVVGVVSVARMPVDMFPSMNLPVVSVATFYNGMPPEQIETSITARFERFFTLASGIDHIESRSLSGVSLIKVYFQPGIDADAAVSVISNLATANLRRLPPGTLPPIVLKTDASSLPVCLVTVSGEGMGETELRDIAQYNLRNQVAVVPGASVPQPFGGKYRQIMVYVDPLKLEAHQLSPMDVVRSLNEANLILPAGDIRVGKLSYPVYTNSQLDTVEEIARVPLKVVGQAAVRVADVAEARDAQQLQVNVVRVDGQRSVYTPVLKQGGDTNTIAIVDGVRQVVDNLVDVPKELTAAVSFDQSEFVKNAIQTLIHEGAIGIVLTSLMVLIFLGSARGTVAVLLSIPISSLATFLCLYFGGGTINTMVLGGLALAFSRLIDNSVVVLENVFRHLELGEPAINAARKGGSEVALPVLAATLTTAIVFFPVTFLAGVSRYLFSALALAVVISLFASYFVALTVVPLFAARFLKAHHPHDGAFAARFNQGFSRLLDIYQRAVEWSLRKPALTGMALLAFFGASAILLPWIGVAFFPRTDSGQIIVNLKTPPGTRIEVTEKIVQQVENIAREVVAPRDLRTIVSNIGVQPGFSSLYSTNSAQNTAFVQVALNGGRATGMYDYIERIRTRVADELPQVSAFYRSGGLVDAVLNMGLPAQINVQVSGSNIRRDFDIATTLAREIRAIPGVADVYIPQDIDAPALRLRMDRGRAGELGINQRETVSNLITALSSNQMIAPSYWIDPRSGQDYMLTVQYPDTYIQSLSDLESIPLRGIGRPEGTRLGAITQIDRTVAPTSIDRYQLRRAIDVYVSLDGEDLGRVADSIDRIIARTKIPDNVRVDLRGMVQGMRESFRSFGFGLILSVALLYLVLVAQFRSFVDPVLILLAVPPGIAGVVVTLFATHTTLNVQSLMGVVMLVGIAVSNSILIVEFAHRLREGGMGVRESIISSCRVRLRPVLMTSLATIIGLLPMALKLGEGSEAYAPLARAIIGGLTVSVAFSVFLVPAGYLLVYRRRAH